VFYLNAFATTVPSFGIILVIFCIHVFLTDKGRKIKEGKNERVRKKKENISWI
jgi:hypothetical protein